MDLFDLDCYFAHRVQVQACVHLVLFYAVCAYAAKQLRYVKGRKAVIGGIVNQQADMELVERNPNLRNPDPITLHWEFAERAYYGMAIKLLQEICAHRTEETPSSPETGSDDVFSPQADAASSPTPSRIPETKVDVTLSAAAILCAYEFLENAYLDNGKPSWAVHLSGTKTLFDFLESVLSVESPMSPRSSQR
jgi:hypothetical protein